MTFRLRPTDPDVSLDALSARHRGHLLHRHTVPARAGDPRPMPDWVHPVLLGALQGQGIDRLWSHQLEAATALRAGEHVVVATGTASGKSLAYLLPALTDILASATPRPPTTLYLAPTKALAADQVAHIEALALPGVRAATYDGDTPPDERRWIRDHAGVVLTNPDLVHHSLLPQHAAWASFLRRLRYVVVDECHVYRGVVGTHVAAVLRRLRRLCAAYRSEPVFLLASATTADPGRHALALLGLPARVVDLDGSPRDQQVFGLWDPQAAAVPDSADSGESAGSRAVGDVAASGDVGDVGDVGGSTVGDSPSRSALTEAAVLMGDLVAGGVQTVTFARSRAGVEAVALRCRDQLAESAPGLVTAVAAYRGGYLPEDRRAIEDAVRDGAIRALAATNALELGVDISGLDAVILAGWPGTRASLWQQAGRAGRAGRPSLAILVAGDDPLDAYLVRHPEKVFGAPVEATVLDPVNPYVLAPHLTAAAAERPLTDADAEYFGPGMAPLADALVASGLLRRRPRGWFWTHPNRPTDDISLRGSGQTVRIVESGTGRIIGTIDAARAMTSLHTGAVHVHQGTTYVVTRLDLEDASATVVAGDPGWTTQSRSASAFDILAVRHRRTWGEATLSFGDVAVRSQVTSFRRRLRSGHILGEHPLDLPQQTLTTRAIWWTVPEEHLTGLGIAPEDIPGSLHAAEHASIGMLPLIATADRWDIGGVSTAVHPQTGLPTVMVYDGHPGGAGFAERGYDVASTWLAATHDTIAECGCDTGCPSCVQSPKCGNGNEPLSKSGAIQVLDLLLSWSGATASTA